MSSRAKVAATAFLRFDMSREKSLAGDLEATLELHAPFHALEIEVAGEPVPLEADLTAPLAYSLDDGRMFNFELSAFFSADYARHQQGIFMVQPYVPGRIPVVFVHGTASSPARWAQMFNALQSDRRLRENYQFYFFIYATGSPVTYSAHLLRDALGKVLRKCDPGGADAMMQQMVLVGHSQGGLLVRLQVTDSGNRFWAEVSDIPLEDYDLMADEEQLIRRVMFFEPVPAVKRVIFIATPHRGSFLSGTWYSRLASSMMRLPGQVTRSVTDLMKSDAAAKLRRRLGGRVQTSLDSMDPRSPFVKVLGECAITPEVTYHSIIPVAGGGAVGEENDGVVEYRSAHLDGAASEVIIRSPHSCQDNPLTVLEVRRILLEHLKAVKKK
jgi:triacylglycerol esterase/lipase EstA (alpha/beta hydrolase family)